MNKNLEDCNCRACVLSDLLGLFAKMLQNYGTVFQYKEMWACTLMKCI